MTLFVAAGLFAFAPGCNLIETRDVGASGGSSSAQSSSGGKASGGTTTSAGGTTSSGGGSSSGGDTGSPGGATMEGGAGGAVGGTEGGTGGTTGIIVIGGRTNRGGAGGGGRTGATGGATRGGAGGSGAGGTTPMVVCTDDPPPDQPQTCAEWVSWGTCTQEWFANYCNRSCGRCGGGQGGGSGGAGGSGGVSGSGGTTARGGSGGNGGVSGPGTTNPQITGTNGWASRYWDCCKPSCGWTANSNPPVPSCQKDGSTRVGADARNGCEGGGTAFECYDFTPWYDAATNMSYGFAAKNGVSCGSCFMIQFTGDGHSGPNDGAAKLRGQQMIVQAINIGGIEQNQFDLLIPGGGVGAMNGCATQWGSSTELGAQYGGLLTTCKGDATCMKGKCQSVFGNMPTLKAGCDWFTGWFSSADNPNLVYKQVSCPSQLSSKTGLSK